MLADIPRHSSAEKALSRPETWRNKSFCVSHRITAAVWHTVQYEWIHHHTPLGESGLASQGHDDGPEFHNREKLDKTSRHSQPARLPGLPMVALPSRIRPVPSYLLSYLQNCSVTKRTNKPARFSPGHNPKVKPSLQQSKLPGVSRLPLTLITSSTTPDNLDRPCYLMWPR